MHSDFPEEPARIAVVHIPPPGRRSDLGVRYVQAGLHKLKSVLLCLDGVADVLGEWCLAFNQQLYALYPERGGVFSVIASPVGSDPTRLALKLGESCGLVMPTFDLFVSGCYGCSSNGFAYSPSETLKRLYVGLQARLAITPDTRRIVLASSDMLDDGFAHQPCFMRAHARLDAFGLHTFAWGSERLGVIALRTPAEEPEEIPMFDICETGWDWPDGQPGNTRGGARQTHM